MEKFLKYFTKCPFLPVLITSLTLLVPAHGYQTVEEELSFTLMTNAVGNKEVIFSVTPNGAVIVTPFAPDVVRVRFHWTGTTNLFDREEVAIDKAFPQWPSFPANFTNVDSNTYLIETDQLTVEIEKRPEFKIHFKDPSGYMLLEDINIEYDPGYFPTDDTNAYAQIQWASSGSFSVSNFPSGFKLRSIKKMPTNAAFFGGGDFSEGLNRKGRRLQYWNQDTFGFEEDRNPKYLSLPMIYGVLPASGPTPTFAYGLFFNNPARPVFDFTNIGGEQFTFEAGDDQLDYFFFSGNTDHTMAHVLDRYSELTGRPAKLPKWAYGYHQSRHSYSTQQTVHDLVDMFTAEDFPCDAIYLDIDTQDSDLQRHQLTLNDTFTNAAHMSAYCANQGIQLIPLVEPCLTLEDPKYEHAATNLYFLKTQTLSNHVGVTFLGPVSWLDFSISHARDWWKTETANFLTQTGFKGLWNDLNEPNENAIPLNTLHFLDGQYGGGTVTNDSRKWHINNKNTYANRESVVSYDTLLQAYPNERPLVISRSGWPGIQKHAIGWSGDNRSNFDHLRYSLPMSQNVLISGQAHYGHDVGGFDGDANAELLTRWIQAGCLAPFFRNHANTVSTNQEPWVHSDLHSSWNRYWIKFRYQMMPYLYTLAHQSTETGQPMNTPTVFHFTGDVNTYSQNDYDFMVGHDLLVAPVYHSLTNQRSVYLPYGPNWYNWADDSFYTGGQTIAVPASLGVLPLFTRAGSIIPMGPTMQYADEFAPDFMDVHIWPGGTNAFTLYEDDGRTFDYDSGAFAKTTFQQATQSGHLLITIATRQGSFDPGTRNWFFKLHNMPQPDGVMRSGTALTRVGEPDQLASHTQAFCYNNVTRVLTVKCPDNGLSESLNIDFATEDQDNDGMPDWWELAHQLNHMGYDPDLDSDGDWRQNLDEYLLNSDPNYADNYFTEYEFLALAGDHNRWNEAARNMFRINHHVWACMVNLNVLNPYAFKFVADDAWSAGNWGDNTQPTSSTPLFSTAHFDGSNIEINSYAPAWYTITFDTSTSNYTVLASSTADSDQDGLSDDYERLQGTHPFNRADALHDHDEDGLTASNELFYGTSPYLIDTDGDFSDDRDEVIAGTNPQISTQFFSLNQVEFLPGNPSPKLTWLGQQDRFYDVYSSTNLYSTWSVVPALTGITGTGLIEKFDTSTPTESQKYYKLRVTYPGF